MLSFDTAYNHVQYCSSIIQLFIVICILCEINIINMQMVVWWIDKKENVHQKSALHLKMLT